MYKMRSDALSFKKKTKRNNIQGNSPFIYVTSQINHKEKYFHRDVS